MKSKIEILQSSKKIRKSKKFNFERANILLKKLFCLRNKEVLFDNTTESQSFGREINSIISTGIDELYNIAAAANGVEVAAANATESRVSFDNHQDIRLNHLDTKLSTTDSTASFSSHFTVDSVPMNLVSDPTANIHERNLTAAPHERNFSENQLRFLLLALSSSTCDCYSNETIDLNCHHWVFIFYFALTSC